jgi:hypothetical protein
MDIREDCLDEQRILAWTFRRKPPRVARNRPVAPRVPPRRPAAPGSAPYRPQDWDAVRVNACPRGCAAQRHHQVAGGERIAIEIRLIAKGVRQPRQALADHLDHRRPAQFRPFLAGAKNVDRRELHHERLDAIERRDQPRRRARPRRRIGLAPALRRYGRHAGRSRRNSRSSRGQAPPGNVLPFC